MRLLTDRPFVIRVLLTIAVVSFGIARIVDAHSSLPSCVIVLHPAYALPERVVAEVRVGGEHSFWCGVAP